MLQTLFRVSSGAVWDSFGAIDCGFFREMEKGFLNSPKAAAADHTKSEDIGKDLVKKIRNIEGKVIGKDGTRLQAKRGEVISEHKATFAVADGPANVIVHNPKGQPLKSILKQHGIVEDGRTKTSSSPGNNENEGCLQLDVADVVENTVCSKVDAEIRAAPKVVVVNAQTEPASFVSKDIKKVSLSVLKNDNKVLGCNVEIPLAAVQEVCDLFANTICGYFIGKRLAFPIVDMYVKNVWAKYGLERVVLRKGLFLFKFRSNEGMNKVLEGGPWLIRSVPLFLNVWSPNSRLHKEEIKAVPVWVKIHEVPIVAYSEIGLSLITTELGRPIMLDTYTSDMCLNPWGTRDYARALVEVSAEVPLLKNLVVAIPFSDGSGHSMETLEVEYEWQPPRCNVCKTFDHDDKQCPKRKCEPKHTSADEEGFVQVMRKKTSKPTVNQSRPIDGIRLPKPKTNWFYRAVSKPKSTNSTTNSKPKYVKDNINGMELKNSFAKLSEEDKVLDAANGADMVDTSHHDTTVTSDVSNVHEVNNGNNVNEGADVASSSKPKLSFGHLDLSNVSDSDEDEVFASQDEFNAYMSSIGGGNSLEMEDYDEYDDYADQIRDLPGEIQALRDIQLHHRVRK